MPKERLFGSLMISVELRSVNGFRPALVDQQHVVGVVAVIDAGAVGEEEILVHVVVGVEELHAPTRLVAGHVERVGHFGPMLRSITDNADVPLAGIGDEEVGHAVLVQIGQPPRPCR